MTIKKVEGVWYASCTIKGRVFMGYSKRLPEALIFMCKLISDRWK